MLISISRRAAGLPRLPLAILIVSIAFAVVSQVSALGQSAGITPAAEGPAGDGPAADVAPNDADPLGPGAASVSAADLERIRANISFWGGRLRANPRDLVSATKLATSEIELARATGDIGAYAAANEALDAALSVDPGYPAALAYRGVVLIALHRFVEARDHASAILAVTPDDPTALATLGDALLELGDVDGAAGAYQTLALVADSAAARVRLSHLAFIQGRTAEAVAQSEAALLAAKDEGATGSAMAWFQYQRGESLIATGDRVGATSAYAAALTADPASHLARWGLARVAAADGRLDEAIERLDEAIATVPLPEFLARRAGLFDLRAATGDADRADDDRATVLAIAGLAGSDTSVYDRTLSLFLSDTGLDPARAVALAEAELGTRKDVYGYDALAWALLADDRPAEADDAMSTALAFGTRDAKLLYHAGMIKAALGDAGAARTLLEDALGLDASFDPVAAGRARETLERLP